MAAKGNGDLAVTTPAPEDLHPVAPYDLVERMRASVVVLGLLLARCGEVHMPLPGGDDFGDRPIDFHVNGLTAMGAHFEISHGEVRACASRIGSGPHDLETAEQACGN